MTTLTFAILLLGLRVLSGVQNGLGYAESRLGDSVQSLRLARWAVTLISVSSLLAFPWSTGFYVLPLLACLSLVGVSLSFDLKNHPILYAFCDIHLFESIWAGCVWLWGLIATWPFALDYIFVTGLITPMGMVLFKGAINIGDGSPFFDLSENKYWLLRGYKIPRLVTNGETRWRIASACLFVLALYLIFR